MDELEKPTPTESESGSWVETGRFFVVVLGIALFVRFFVATPFIVSGASMFPTFHDKEYLIVEKVSYLTGAPARGDVVVFRYPKDVSQFFIKRIIGLPGETLTIAGGKVTITKKDGTAEALDETYIREPFDTDETITLGSTEYFVMGDNRNESSDSRRWGPLDQKYLTGHVFARLFPFNRVTYLPGKANLPQ